MARLIFVVNYAFPHLAVAVLLLFLSAHTIPLDLNRNEKLEDIVVSSGNLQLKRDSRNTQQHSANFKTHEFGNWTKFKNHEFGNWTKSKWDKWDKWDNSSIFKKLDEMMESIERDLEELMNDTLSYADFLRNSETFADMDESVSFSESDSFSASASMSESGSNEEPIL